MDNEQKIPDAYKELSSDGIWIIYCFPFRRLNGWDYQIIEGYIDETHANLIVDLINGADKTPID